jgi:hypothetical protein
MMGIFDLFKKNQVVPRIDFVWFSSAAKLNGTLDYLSKNRPDLCVAWFEETHRVFNRCFNEERHMNIEIKMAKYLRPHDLNNKNVVFLEHYPLYTREANLLSDNRYNKPAYLCFMCSLDDTFFHLYRGSIEKIVRSLGLGEYDYIESRMVSNAVITAQKKLDKKIREDFNARSGEEWMEMYRTYYKQHRRG